MVLSISLFGISGGGANISYGKDDAVEVKLQGHCLSMVLGIFYGLEFVRNIFSKLYDHIEKKGMRYHAEPSKEDDVVGIVA